MWFQGERLLEPYPRIGRVSHETEQDPDVERHLGVTGRKPRGRLQFAQRLVLPSRRSERESEIEVALARVRIRGEEGAHEGFGVGEVAAIELGDSRLQVIVKC